MLLAAFNGLPWIAEQVDSILAQSGVDVSLFISVDLSRDGTHQWCRERSLDDGRVKLLEYGPRFGGAAANFFRLIREVDFDGFDYVALADQDDIWRGEKLLCSVESLRAERAHAFSSNVTAFWPDGREKLLEKSQPQRRYDHYFEAGGPGCTYLLRGEVMQRFKEFLQRNREVAERVALHDWLIYAYCRARGMKWHIDPRPLVLYRQHDNG